MKDFVKTMLAVICAYIVMQLLSTLFFLFFFGSLLVSGSGKVILPRTGVLDMDMSSFVIGEQTKEASPTDMLSSYGLNGEVVPTIGLSDAVQALKLAAADPGIQYVLLRPDGLSAGMASVEELRAALADFRKSGKAVIAFTEAPGNGSYFLATVADKIYMSAYHGGDNRLLGISSTMIFLKDILDKVGVHVQLIRHGKYKSAGEMYIRSNASAENREQHQVMVTSAWKAFSSAMAQARGISEEELNALIDNLELKLPEDFLQKGLVDELMDHETLLSKLCILSGVADAKNLQLVPLSDYVTAKVMELPSRSHVAVIYADGEIVEGKGYDNIAGDRFVGIIDEVRKDASIKAVVLRVNSPGGSVLASIKIRTALDLLQKEKPLVASFGDYAASGGYWISNGCQKIYADETSITGSIGVFSMVPEFSKVTDKVGVHVESVSSNKHSDMYSLMRPFDAAETAYMQASIEDIYESFVNLVAEGRGMTPERVDEIAQGRVWLGSDALGIGLVDEIGTLQDAIAYAASLASLTQDDYTLLSYPQQLTFFEELMRSLNKMNEGPSILEGTPFESFGVALQGIREMEPAKAYARLPYAFDMR